MKILSFTFCLYLFNILCLNGQTNTFPSSGNVGIGTSSPSTYLQLGTTNAYRVLYTMSGGITVRYYQLGTISHNNGDFRINGILGGHTNGQGKATIDIKFSMRDGFKALGSVYGEVGSSSDIIVFGDSSNNHIVLFLKLDDWALTNLQLEASSGGSITHNGIYTETDPSVSYGAPIYSLQSNAGQQIRINNFGNVGIGTTNPDAKLTVKGNIHTQEVKVDLLGAVAPDYVFHKDYDLKSLKTVEDYIVNHGHLPNIPSAKDMETNGIMLKEMNLKLLEKIEELTLYAIEQEKKLEKVELLEGELQNQKTINTDILEKFKSQETRLQTIEAVLNSKKQ